MSCQGQTAVSEPPVQLEEQPIVEEVVVEPTEVPAEPEEPEAVTAVPTVPQPAEEQPTEEPTLPSPTATFEPTPELIVEEENFMQTGRTELGAYYLGSPNAPIRLIDYSDFL